MKLSEIGATLREIRVSPVKTLGQNFLHDRNLARWIVEKAELTPEDYVVEIGPGLGALTEFVLESGASVLAIEKDQTARGIFCANVSQQIASKFSTRTRSIMTFANLFAKPRVKLLGNLPYYISSQLLLKFTKYPSPISLWLLMLQKEMARRISASPGTKPITARSHSSFNFITGRVSCAPFQRAFFFRSQTLIRPSFASRRDRPTNCRSTTRKHFSDSFGAVFRNAASSCGTCSRKSPGLGARPQAAGFEPRARAEELSSNSGSRFRIHVDRSERPDRGAPLPQSVSRWWTTGPVIGDATRAEVHGNNLRHRAVHILVFNHSSEIFLQKRSRWKDRHPGLWDSSAAGHVDAGEDYDEAADRELNEELGVKAALTRVTKLPASEQTGQEFIWLYRAGTMVHSSWLARKSNMASSSRPKSFRTGSRLGRAILRPASSNAGECFWRQNDR